MWPKFEPWLVNRRTDIQTNPLKETFQWREVARSEHETVTNKKIRPDLRMHQNTNSQTIVNNVCHKSIRLRLKIISTRFLTDFQRSYIETLKQPKLNQLLSAAKIERRTNRTFPCNK